jgi:hypothetical protein
LPLTLLIIRLAADTKVAAALSDAITYGRFFLERFARGFFTTDIP